MTKPYILLVEDDRLTTRMVSFLLNESGYRFISFFDPREVVPFLNTRSVDLVILDVTLPHMNGYALCATLRRSHPDIPIIFLTGRNQLDDKLEGFNLGADDFIAKPFDPAELLVRIQAVLRRYRRAERHVFGSEIKVGQASLDLGELQFRASNAPPAVLTPTEMKILEYLMRNANTVISREVLVERIWGYDYEGESNRIDVYIRRLRKKIEADPGHPTFIHTVRGMGYVFRGERHVA